MKYVLRASPVLIGGALAVALFLSFIGILNNTGPAHAVAGTVNFRATTSTASTAIGFATINREVGVIVVDADLDPAATTTVKVTSGSDSTGITLTLSRDTTGIYSALLKVSTTTSTSTPAAGNPVIQAADGDTITVNYSDANPAGLETPDTLTVETGKPTISALSPATSTITNVGAATLSVDVQDGISSIDKASIKFLFKKNPADGVPDIEIPPLDFTDIFEGATKVGFTATRSFTFTEGVTYIGVKVKDGAGNETIFDGDAVVGGNQGNRVVMDKTAPTLKEVTTGNAWDGKTVKKNVRTSIEVEFNDNLLNLDPTSVQSTDFAVSGTTVTAADLFSAPGERPLSVFLTVADEIGPAAKPTVSIVGDGVKDQAGNALVNVNKASKDGIAPKLTISLSKTLAGKDDLVEITVTSDEALAADPQVKVMTIEKSGATTTQAITAIKSVGTLTFKATTAKTNKTGLVNVSVAANDKATVANAATAGVEGATDAQTANAVTYQSDVALPAATTTPMDTDKPITRDPFFITIDFVDEGAEYNDDTNKTVTLTKLSLDGTSILGQESTQDNIKFLIAISGITSAEHTLVFNATDAAGNKLAADKTVKFTVTNRAKIKINLQPGINLVSLPGDPTDTDINAVLANNPEITHVISYDPSLPGLFLQAERGGDGLFAGTLLTIDSSRGYWMLTSLFKALEVTTAPLAAGAVGTLPPAIPIVADWNLVPVVDITGTKAAGATITADSYFKSVEASISKIYTFDTVLNQWVFVDHAAGDNVVIGKAYWVYSTKAGVLVP